MAALDLINAYQASKKAVADDTANLQTVTAEQAAAVKAASDKLDADTEKQKADHDALGQAVTAQGAFGVLSADGKSVTAYEPDGNGSFAEKTIQIATSDQPNPTPAPAQDVFQ